MMRTLFSIAAVLSIVALPASALEDVRHPFSASVPRAGIRRVFVDITAGDVSVRNGSGHAIAISGEVRRECVQSSDTRKQQAIVDDMTEIINVSGDTALIEPQYGPNAAGWATRYLRTNVRIVVEVPSDMDVELGTHYGDVSIEGEFGDVDVDLRAGEIRLRTPRDAVRDLNASVRVGEVHADYGDSRVNNDGVFPGSTNFHNANGRRSHINLHTTAGEVHVLLTR